MISPNAQTKMDGYEWDKEADRLVPDWENGRYFEVVKLIGERPTCPSRRASAMCESGKRNYCTCDTCF